MTDKIISADCHLDIGWLPPDTFTSRVPAKWRDRVPQIQETDAGPRWIADGIDLSGVAGVGSKGRPYSPGRWKRGDRMAETGLYSDGLLRPANPVARLADQDRDGVVAEVIYGIFAVSTALPDKELASVISTAFNEWMADFCATNPNRYLGLACLPAHDAEAAAAEFRHAAERGLRGGVLDYLNGFAPIYHEGWDPLWQAAQELDLPISLHVSRPYSATPAPAGAAVQPTGYDLVEAALDLSLQQVHNASDAFAIIFGGALDRFPALNIILAESGIGWIPSVLERMDYQYDNAYTEIGLKLRPSEYWQRQMYATFQTDPVGLRLVDELGDDHLMFASDYPHPDGIWPDSRQFVEAEMSSLTDESRRRILFDNAAALYHVEG